MTDLEVMCTHEYALRATEADLNNALHDGTWGKGQQEALFEALRVLTAHKIEGDSLRSSREHLQGEFQPYLSCRLCAEPRELLRETEQLVREASGFLRIVGRHVLAAEEQEQCGDQLIGQALDTSSTEDRELIDGLVDGLKELEEVSSGLRVKVTSGLDQGSDAGGDFAQAGKVGGIDGGLPPVVGEDLQGEQRLVVDHRHGPISGTGNADIAGEDHGSQSVNELRISGAGEPLANLGEPAEGLQVDVDPAAPLDGAEPLRGVPLRERLPFLEPFVQLRRWIQRVIHSHIISRSAVS